MRSRTAVEDVFRINVDCTDFDRLLAFYPLAGFKVVVDPLGGAVSVSRLYAMNRGRRRRTGPPGRSTGATEGLATLAASHGRKTRSPSVERQGSQGATALLGLAGFVLVAAVEHDGEL